MLKILTQKYITAFCKKDLASISAMLSDSFILEDPVVKQVKGKLAALSVIQGIFDRSQKLDFSAKNIYKDGNSTIIEFILDVDGVVLEGVDIIDWQDEKMVELRAYLYTK